MKLREFIISTLLICLFPTLAIGSDERFCIQKIDIFKGADRTEIVGVKKVLTFENARHSIYFLGTNKALAQVPAILNGNNFYLLDFYSKSFNAMPDGTILSYVGRIGEKPNILQLDNDSTAFQIKNFEEGRGVPERVNAMVWSSPLNGMLVAQSGTLGLHGAKKEKPNLYLMQDNVVQLLEGVDGWITRIVDFPELNITFLGTEHEDRIYLIDANKQIYNVGELNLGKWIFFKNVYHLRNPDRLLVVAQETMGPYRGLFQINLVKDEVWKPSEKQNFVNLRDIFKPPSKHYPNHSPSYYDENLGEYFIVGRNYEGINGYYLGLFPAPKKDVPLKLYKVGAVQIEEVDSISGDVFNSLPPVYLKDLHHPDAEQRMPNYDELAIEMPLSKVAIVIRESGIYARDKNGLEKRIDQNQIQYHRHSIRRYSKYLEQQNAVFVNAPNGYFLIKDKKLSGDGACND